MNTVTAQGCPNSPVREVQNNPLKAIETINELLAALQSVLRYADQPMQGETDYGKDCREIKAQQARAAIAKATA